MEQDPQKLRSGIPTLASGDLLSIVKARAGWFHPDLVVMAGEELGRRGMAIPRAVSDNPPPRNERRMRVRRWNGAALGVECPRLGRIFWP
jgi:hypothetical protein